MTEQQADQPNYMLLVPHNTHKLVDLYDMDDRVGDHLSKEGASAPLAKVNLGEGRAVVFGIGRHAHRNSRAEMMLALWAPVYIELRGPVVFTGISARQSVELVRVSQDGITLEAAQTR